MAILENAGFTVDVADNGQIAFEMLKTVDMVGDTISWSSSGFCGKKQPMPVGLGGPAIRCKITVGGR